MPKRVFISTSTFGEKDPTLIDLLEQHDFKVTLNPYKRKLTKPESLQLFPQFDGLIAGLETLDDEVLSASTLKVISRCGAGLSNIDLHAAKKLGIQIFSTPDAPTTAVAELTVGVLLTLLRKTHVMDHEFHQGRWTKMLGVQLAGKTVVIIGCGRIGLRVAQLLDVFGVRLIGVDPCLKQSHLIKEIMPLHEALPLADIMTIHVNGEEEIIGPREFGLMKKDVYLLNAARGGVINEAALTEALQQKLIAGAWLDTFVDEPYKGELINYPQILLTPHVGSYTEECRRQMEREAVVNLIEGFNPKGNGRA